MSRPSFPKTLRQFQADFATEEACREYLTACRWPDGFVCPRCEHARAYELVSQRRRQCIKCRHQVSLTSGTILHRAKIPLTHWFWAAYLMTTDKRSVSALLNAAREPLRGEVEVMTRGLAASKPGCKGVGNSRTSGRHSF